MMFQQRDKIDVSLEARTPWQIIPIIMLRSCGQIKTGEKIEVIPCEKCYTEVMFMEVKPQAKRSSENIKP